MSAIFSDLKNKPILITGATRGIGRDIAKSLATQGSHVIFNYREGKTDVAESLKKELLELGASKVDALEFDVTDAQAIATKLGDFVKENGPITGVVNNAGISKDQIILRLKEADIDQALDVNLKGPILVTVALSRGFLKAESVSIVNVSSIVGLMGNASQIAYASSKAGLIGFTKSLAKELASRKVRCNAICPGFIDTDMTETLDPKVKEGYLSGIPLQRFGNPTEVANLTCFLLSDCSSYITGEVIKIDGGLYI